MAIPHTISNGDYGLGIYIGGAWHSAKEVYVYDGGWVQAAQIYYLHSITGTAGAYTYNWQYFAATDKYAPTLTPQSVSATPGTLPGRPTVVHWTEDTNAPGGQTYQLNITPHNLTQGLQDTTITQPGGRSAGAHTYSYGTPTGWNSGDEIYFVLAYQDTSGYSGPTATTGYVYLP